MKKEEYVKTLIIKEQKIEVGLDDYGQCYFFEYKDKNGKVQEICCGLYNPNYEKEIADYFGINAEEIEEVS